MSEQKKPNSQHLRPDGTGGYDVVNNYGFVDRTIDNIKKAIK